MTSWIPESPVDNPGHSNEMDDWGTKLSTASSASSAQLEGPMQRTEEWMQEAALRSVVSVIPLVEAVIRFAGALADSTGVNSCRLASMRRSGCKDRASDLGLDHAQSCRGFSRISWRHMRASVEQKYFGGY